MSSPSIPRGPGLYEFTEGDGQRAVTNVRKLAGRFRPAAGSERPPGRILVNVAAALLGVLDLGLFAVSLAAQYQYILHAKHLRWPSVIEAGALDAGMVIFSLLALGLARGRQTARTERVLIVLCALGSAGMNYAAADVTSLRSVAAYVMPSVFLAIVTDRVISVVRRHMLGMEAERSAWSVLGRAAVAILAGSGKAMLYGLRLVLAPRSTCSGARALVLLATPLPGAHHLVQEHAQLDTARAALTAAHAAIGDDLRALRDRNELAAADLAGGLDTVREEVRTQVGTVRGEVRTQAETVRDTVRTTAATAAAAVLSPVREELGDGLRELRQRQEETVTGLADGLRATRDEIRTEHEAVRDAVRTEADAVRDDIRTQGDAVREALRQAAADSAPKPPAVDRDAVVSQLANQIRDAVSSGGQWAPDYPGLQASTGYSRSWCEKAVRDARTQVFTNPGLDTSTDPEEAS